MFDYTCVFGSGSYEKSRSSGVDFSGLIAAFLNAAILIGALPFWKLSLAWGHLLKSLIKILVAGGGLIATTQFYFWMMKMEKGLQVPALFITILFSIGIYFILSAVLRIEEFSKIRRLFPL